MISLAASTRIYLALATTDMRKGDNVLIIAHI